MKILHLCLASFYIDNYAYQENLLPKYHKAMGHDVEIIASLVSFNENGKVCTLEKGGTYFNEYGIKVTRLEYEKLYKIPKRFRRYSGTFKQIDRIKPDIIFIHGCQFYDILDVKKYIQLYPQTKVYVDNHADFSNSATNWVSKNILHKIIWRYCANKIEPFTEKFYGVLPARVKFLEDIYKLPKEKIEFLPMGADDDRVNWDEKDNIRKQIREKYNIKDSDFLILTGGKIDLSKTQIILLIEAVKKMSREVKLIIFGSIIPELQEKVKNLCDGEQVQYIGWINSNEVYSYFHASELAVFPGRHSVIWEQAVGSGLPCIFKYWPGTTHVDLGGNCEFIYKDSIEEIYNTLDLIINNKNRLTKMRIVAENEGKRYFSYKDISARAIDLKE